MFLNFDQNEPRFFMKYYFYKKSVIRLAFATKIETAAVVRSSQNPNQMQSKRNITSCIPWQKISRLSLQTHKKTTIAYIPDTSFIQFLVQICKERHFYGKLILMSIPAIHFSCNLDYFICSSCEGSKKISDSFRLGHN